MSSRYLDETCRKHKRSACDISEMGLSPANDVGDTHVDFIRLDLILAIQKGRYAGFHDYKNGRRQ